MIGALLLSLLLGASEADSAAAHRDLAADTTATPRDSVYLLPEVRVERERELSAARRRLPTAFITELHTASSNRALETTAELLRQAAGVHVVRYGGLGSYSTVSLRGASPSQVSIYLDGVPVSSASRGAVDLSDLPVAALDRIEVYRGLAPLAFGPSTPGGAVNLVTLSSPELMELRFTRGSFDTWEARGTGGARRGIVSGLIHGGYQGSAGDFPFLFDNGTPFNAGDDRVTRRGNNRFDAMEGLVTVGIEPRAGPRVRLSQQLFHKAQGVPGLRSRPAPHPRHTFERSLTHAVVEYPAAGFWPAVRVATALERERERLRDPEAELDLGSHDTDDRLGSDQVSIGLGWQGLPAGTSLEAGGSLRSERADLHDSRDGYPDPPQSRRSTRGASAALRLRPIGDRLTIYLARRWDRVEDRLRSLGVLGVAQRSDQTRRSATPQLGLGVRGPVGLEARANWTRSQRSPEFLELFGNQGSVMGNPLLSPELGESWDAGGSWSWGSEARRIVLEYAHYQSRNRDLILFVRNSPRSERAENISRSRIRGDEFAVRATSPTGLGISGSWTRQTALDEGAVPFWHGKRLPQHPAREVVVELAQSVGPLRAALDLHVIGDNFLNRYNTDRVASRPLVGASFSINRLARHLRLVFEGKNLGNNRVSDVGGFPLPGRSVFVSCQARLGAAASPP